MTRNNNHHPANAKDRQNQQETRKQKNEGRPARLALGFNLSYVRRSPLSDDLCPLIWAINFKQLV